MKETKVYVDKMPEDCWDCLIHNGEDGHCKILNNFTDYISKDCPLIGIKDHDRELVKEVCEKIEDWCNKNFNWVGDGTGYDGQDYNEMIGSNDTINKLRGFLS